MIYQLPNGKIINISIEAYLRMSDEDLRYINESNFGSSVEDVSPFAVTEDFTDDVTEDIQFVEEYLEDLPEDIEFLDEVDFDEE
jgi:hypothetical protein